MYLPNVVKVIEISRFTIESQTLVHIIKGARNSEILSLTDCNISVDEGIKFENSFDYKFFEFLLHGSLHKSSGGYLNETTLEVLAKAMSQTNIKSKLITCRTMDHQFTREEIMEIFNKEGFNITC